MFGKLRRRNDQEEPALPESSPRRITVIRATYTGVNVRFARVELYYHQHSCWLTEAHREHKTFFVENGRHAGTLRDGDEATIWVEEDPDSWCPIIVGCRNHTLGDDEFLSEEQRTPHRPNPVD